jgi:type IV/VI secretion system ImpK/VasF family protein
MAGVCHGINDLDSARAPEEVLPVYDHDNLAGCFNRLVLMLRQGLSLVLEEHAIQLPLTERTHGLNVATLPSTSMAREFGFVLAVKANVPGEMLQTHFPAQMKVAPVTKIRDLVQLQLPGMKLRAMPVAPPQIPWHAGYNYFELEKGASSGAKWRNPAPLRCIWQVNFQDWTWNFGPSVARKINSERKICRNNTLTAVMPMLRARNNPLVTAANPLLNAIPQIRHSVSHDDQAGLRQQLIDEIRRFEVRCQQSGLAYEVIVGARYCLCTALDEAAALTLGEPWRLVRQRATGDLSQRNLGGEKFFQLLARLSQNPREHIVLLELINFCLLLGFEGRYRVMDNGRTQLETIKQRLWQMIRGVRGNYPPPLSPHPEDQPVLRKLWRPMIPLWACVALAGFLACLFYIVLNWRLGDNTNPVLAKIYQTTLPEAAIAQPAPSLPRCLTCVAS